MLVNEIVSNKISEMLPSKVMIHVWESQIMDYF